MIDATDVNALRPAIVGVNTTFARPVKKLSRQRTVAETVAPGATRIVLAVGEVSDSVAPADAVRAAPVTVTADPAVAAAVHELNVNDL
jgi:hypothetical protein